MNPKDPIALCDELSALIGPDAVDSNPEVRASLSGDKWFAHELPDVAVFPATAEMAGEVLRFANEHRIPVTPRGAGIGYVGGCVPVQRGISLSLSRMDRILEISPADGVAVVQPGVITGHLQEQVAARGLFYPPDPASLKECSIGGNIATNAGGPRCLKYGVTRHYVLGLEVVLASGDILRAGSRTHKNKTGFDLVGLFTGSEGLLGVVTEATLRLIPLPPARAVLSASFPALRDAADAVQRILGSGYLPAALEIADAFTLQAAREYLGHAAVPDGQGHLLVELDGQLPAVEADAKAIESLIRAQGALTLSTAFGPDCDRLWELRRKFSEALKVTGLTKLNEDIVVPRGRLVDLCDFAAALGRKHGFPIACFGHAGDGNIHTNLMAANYEDPAVRDRVRLALDELFTRVLTWGGVITGEHGIGLAKKPWWHQATTPISRHVHAAIKNALDPHYILNPGKFLDTPTARTGPHHA